MIEIKFQFDANDLKVFGQYGEAAKVELDKAIVTIAFVIRNTVVKSINQGSRSGRIYKRRLISHRASAPGEYPKTDTGRLVGSMRVNHQLLKAEMGSDLKYSSYLETGTSRMAPRPWLQPSLDKNLKTIENIIEDALKKVLSP